MKKLIIIILAFSSIAQASGYKCTRNSGDPEVLLKAESQNFRFQFVDQGELQLNVTIPEAALNTFHEGKSIGSVLSFVPGWGESDGSIYGRFAETGAVFDIYVSGMAGHVVTTLKGYRCEAH